MLPSTLDKKIDSTQGNRLTIQFNKNTLKMNAILTDNRPLSRLSTSPSSLSSLSSFSQVARKIQLETWVGESLH